MVQPLKEIINLEDFDEASLKEALSTFKCVYSEDSQDVVDFFD